MLEATKIKDALCAKFDFVAAGLKEQRERRLWAEAPNERFREVFDFARTELGFDLLCTITGLDDKETLAAIYHLARPDGWMLNLRTRVPREHPVLQSVSDAFPVALGYERELVDLFGIQVEGLPPGRRYPLPESWPVGDHPLRKDWKKPAKGVDSGAKEAGHG